MQKQKTKKEAKKKEYVRIYVDKELVEILMSLGTKLNEVSYGALDKTSSTDLTRILARKIKEEGLKIS